MPQNYYDIDLVSDDERVMFYTKEGVAYKITTEDPYGFSRISLAEGGTLPRDLDGQFTGYERARMEIDAYHTKKRMEDQAKAQKIEDAIYKTTKKNEAIAEATEEAEKLVPEAKKLSKKEMAEVLKEVSKKDS